jgi:hypothetical protein
MGREYQQIKPPPRSTGYCRISVDVMIPFH